MYLRKAVICILLTTACLAAGGQDTWYGAMSGLHLMYNPAFAGSSGEGTMRISCYSFLPGAGFGLRSVYASYDDYSEKLHGGAGVWISDDMMGEVMNDMRTGLTYAYHLKAGRELYFNAGLTASLVYRGINRGAVTFPDDYDPFGGIISPPSETITDAGNMLFDTGTGISFSSGSWYGGLSVMHLTQPYLSTNQHKDNRLFRLYTLNAGTIFHIGHNDLDLCPAASLFVQDRNMIVYLGTVASMRELSFGLAVWHVTSGFAAAESSVGWDSGSTTITISYSYNILGGGEAVMGTAVVRAGLSISFNNVEKRKAIHVIKLPEL